MVSVQLRNSGQGLWTAFTLPTSVQAAQTLAAAARTLNIADQVRIQASCQAAPTRTSGAGVDIRV
ncbi:MAG: hypothetical protein ACK53I_06920 [Phenylobacterium sp.]